MIPYSLVVGYQNFGETYCFYLQCLQMKRVKSVRNDGGNLNYEGAFYYRHKGTDRSTSADMKRRMLYAVYASLRITLFRIKSSNRTP
jgi:hypothetical protein